MDPILVQINGLQCGKRYTLSDHAEPITLGRDHSCDITLPEPSVSRLHCQIKRKGSTWLVRDCGSKNGTKVNCQTVERAVLRDGDLVRCGSQLLVFKQNGLDSDEPADLFECATQIAVLERQDASTSSEISWMNPGSSRAIEWLASLYNLQAALQRSNDQDMMFALTRSALRKSLPACKVNLWRFAPSQRLAIHRRDEDHPENGTEERAELFARVALDRQTAALLRTGHEISDNPEVADGSGNLILAPMKGEHQFWGLWECRTINGEWDLGPAELEFATNVATQLSLVLENCEHRARLERANENLRHRVEQHSQLLGSSAPMQRLSERITRAASTNSTVLVHGESGTGKELISELIHKLSPRCEGPLIVVNCAAFNESLLESELFGHEEGAFTGAHRRRQGQFERADGGTLFLDEVAEMSAACQAKLLRILEGHPFERLGGEEPIHVDVRLVAATHRNLRKSVREGTFREDLYYRLRVIELTAPPLRERGADVIQLAEKFLDIHAAKAGRGPIRLSEDAKTALLNHDWPGNVRELKNAIERAVVLGDGTQLDPLDLGLAHRQEATPAGESQQTLRSLRDVEQQHIRNVLQAVNGNKAHACRVLGIGRATLYSKLSHGRSDPAASRTST